MAEWVYNGPEQVVPELCAQDDIGGTLTLRPRQTYTFDVPPGDPALWSLAPPVSKPVVKPAPAAGTQAPSANPATPPKES